VELAAVRGELLELGQRHHAVVGLGDALRVFVPYATNREQQER
jgi:hypothetical protein